jgi:hypothetical protein
MQTERPGERVRALTANTHTHMQCPPPPTHTHAPRVMTRLERCRRRCLRCQGQQGTPPAPPARAPPGTANTQTRRETEGRGGGVEQLLSAGEGVCSAQTARLPHLASAQVSVCWLHRRRQRRPAHHATWLRQVEQLALEGRHALKGGVLVLCWGEQGIVRREGVGTAAPRGTAWCVCHSPWM